MRQLPIFVAGLILSALAHADNGSAESQSLRLIAFGDAGTGSQQQKLVGAAMAQVCREQGCDLGVELGDNFYDWGVGSDDFNTFRKAFEEPYKDLITPQGAPLPIHVALGNHDNSGAYFGGDGSDNRRGDNEVAYHYRRVCKDAAEKDCRPSPRWNMPARYYRFTAPGTAAAERPFADFFVVDSSPLAPYRDDPNPAWNPITYGETQQRWLTGQLGESKAHWKVVFGHHPYLSHGAHGNAGQFDEQRSGPDSVFRIGQVWQKFLEQTVCAQGVDLYLAGHDHDMEWLRPVERCGKTQFIVSGAAAGSDKLRAFRTTPAEKDVYWAADNVAGFVWIKLDHDHLTAIAYGVDAQGKLSKLAEHTEAKR